MYFRNLFVGLFVGVIVPVGVVPTLGCQVRGQVTTPIDSVEAAQEKLKKLQASLERNPDQPETLRDVAHLYWLHLGQTDKALSILNRLTDEGQDPTAYLSAMTIAYGRLDVKGAARAARGILRLASHNELARVYSGVAARMLDNIHGEGANDDVDFIELYESLDLLSLPLDTQRLLTSQRARLARRQGDDYRSYYDEQGCIRSWALSSIRGHSGELELSKQHGDDVFEWHAEARSAELSCAVKVFNPTPHIGLRRLRTLVDSADGEVHLHVSSKHAIRVYLNGQQVLATDNRERWPAKVQRLVVKTEPGKHLLELRTPVVGTTTWALVRATDKNGVALPNDRVGAATAKIKTTIRSVEQSRQDWSGSDHLDKEIYKPLWDYLALDEALVVSDYDAAESLVRKMETSSARFGDGDLLIAEFHSSERSRSRNQADAKTGLTLDEGIGRDAQLFRAKLRLFELMIRRGEGDEVVRRLREEDAVDSEGALETSLAWQMLKFRVFAQRGSDYLAQESLLKASSIHSEACPVLFASLQRARQLDQVDKENDLVGRLSSCSGTMKMRGNLAYKRGQFDRAREIWLENLERTPLDSGVMKAIAQVDIAQGRYGEAMDRLAALVEVDPFDMTAYVALADLLAKTGHADEAKMVLYSASETYPESRTLQDARSVLGMEEDILHWRQDGGPVLERYRRESSDMFRDSSEVLVLDHDTVRIFPNGTQRHLIHQMIELRGKAALDKYGEFEPPAGARLIQVHTIKPDGTIVEPELIPEKDGVSLRNLAIGDIFEFEMILESPAMTMVPGYVDLEGFRFQSLDTPYYHSQLRVVYPSDFEIKVEARNGAPTPTVRQQGHLQIAEFTAHEMPRLGTEPFHRSLLDELPHVRVYSTFELQSWVEAMYAQLRLAQRTNPELRSLANSLTQGAGDKWAKLRAVWTYCMANIEEAGDLSTAATSTLANRQGARINLMAAMLREVGVKTETWLAKDNFGPTEVLDGHPMPELYSTPVLAVYVEGDDKPPVMVMVDSKVIPIGYLDPGHSESEALVLPSADEDLARAGKRVTLPASKFKDRRRYDLVLELDEQGVGVLQGSLVLHGTEAISWRSALEQVDRDRLDEVFQQAELARIAHGASFELESLEVEHEFDLDAPLVIRFQAKATSVGVHQGGEWVMPASLIPMNHWQSFATLPSRWSGMVMNYSPQIDARVEIKLLASKFRALPEPRTLDAGFGQYERLIEEGGVGQGRVVLRSRSVLKPQIVDPKFYPKLVQFNRQVESAERSVLRAR